MSLNKNIVPALLASACMLVSRAAFAQSVNQVGDVFYIEMENNDATTLPSDAPNYYPIYGATAASTYAPYINSLVTQGNANAQYVSYAKDYHNVLSTPTGANPSIHPSEPNYLWQEAGSNFGVANDNDPYGGGAVAAIQAYNGGTQPQNLSGLLQNAGISWKSYQEDSNLQTTGGSNSNLTSSGTNSTGSVTSTPVAAGQTTVPLSSFSGTSTSYINPYNGSHQYNFAAKHDGQLFFTATNGGNDTTTANVEASHYAPLQQLATDLTNNTVARYNLITPDQYNDMHTPLTGGFTYNGVTYTGDQAEIAQGDNFLSIVVPQIMASQAWQNNGAIVIWTDETEAKSPNNANDFSHTLMEIVISKLAKGNAYASTLNLTHSQDLATLQDIYGVSANTATGYLGDAANPSYTGTNADGGGGASDLSDLFQPGVISGASVVPEPGSMATVGFGLLGLLAWGSKRRRFFASK